MKGRFISGILRASSISIVVTTVSVTGVTRVIAVRRVEGVVDVVGVRAGCRVSYYLTAKTACDTAMVHHQPLLLLAILAVYFYTRLHP